MIGVSGQRPDAGEEATLRIPGEPRAEGPVCVLRGCSEKVRWSRVSKAEGGRGARDWGSSQPYIQGPVHGYKDYG